MLNIESYMNPLYITAANIVTPISTITFEDLYENAVIFVNILQIGIETIAFIAKEGILEAFTNASTIWTNLTLEKIVYIIILYNLFMLISLENQQKKIAEQKVLIESLEKNIINLNKTERMREDLLQMCIQNIRVHHTDTTKKFELIDKKIKKLDKDLKQYE